MVGEMAIIMNDLVRRDAAEPGSTYTEGGDPYRHNPPANQAHVRVIRFRARIGSMVNEYLGDEHDDHPVCILAVPTGKSFAEGLRSYLTAKGKDAEYCELSTLREYNESGLPRFRRPDRRLIEGRRLVVVDDIFLPDEYENLARQVDSWKRDVEFEDVIYAAEVDCTGATQYAVRRGC